MKTLLHKAEDRGKADHGRLKTRFSFSFADWYEPSRMGFGKLRVINDDWVAPASGFGPHPHKDMEIITIVTTGAVSHQDSMGNTAKVSAGEVQVMSAGTGVVHAEKNDSLDTPLTLFQIWIEPKEYGIASRYAQKAFDFERPGATLLVAPEKGGGALEINQDAFVTLVNIKNTESFQYKVEKEGSGVYLFIISGSANVSGYALGARDALGISEAQTFAVNADSDLKALLLEVPL